LKFPFAMEADSPGSDRTQKITLEKVEIDPKLDESRFSKPPSPAKAPAGQGDVRQPPPSEP